ncbi:DUF4360 domain-containing protein [Actinomadura rubrisoli]|uniref:DUF4360 domain-containing protein n=1 Tax=Actinomadura rubrisoli TaxID=2530368 RepID=A0A4R5BGN3_9ACTN|nr:DUF4360 domain-containing protein [Actinomadura rubrisoli]TDD84609.1 DUF4360 domain-containing protein [Actinomadura rubrisoli]
MILPGRTASAAVGAALVLPALTSSPASAHLPPPGVTISVASANGPGCPPGTVTVDVSGFSPIVTYDAFRVQVGGTSSPMDARKYCEISLKIGAPEGFTYAVETVKHGLSAQLERGIISERRLRYSFQGAPAIREFTSVFSGPRSGGWQASDGVAPAQMVFKPCGEGHDLDVYSELRLDLRQSDPSKISYLTHHHSAYHLVWKPCP